MKPNKPICRLLALALCLALSLTPAASALALEEDGGVIYLRTARDLCDLSERCAFDAWSKGKRVVLTADISLRGVDFEPIASFSGTFDGGGHTISGLHITDSLSPAGLFLTVERGALVRSLKVEGQVTPGGTKEFVGGIAGRNYGTLEECSFFGVIKGECTVGGIVGRNESTGVLANCTASGSLSASRYTGGIAGYNLGTLRACINSVGVNTANVDPSLSLDDLSIDAASSLTDLVSVGAVESRNATSDTGGVAGYSSGALLSCVNRGAVGYPHYGYNVGGVVGRSSGFVDACVSYGTVYGRKDVGGIVGQMEPYLSLSLRDDLIAKLRTELDRLNDLVSSTLDDVDRTSGNVSSRLDSVSSYATAAVDAADALAGQTTDFIDSNIETVNELTDRAELVMDALPDILKALEKASDDSADAINELEQCSSDLTMNASDRNQLTQQSSTLQSASRALDDAVSQLKTDIDRLTPYIDGSETWDNAAVLAILKDILTDLSNAVQALSSMSSSAAGITSILVRYLKDALPEAHDDLDRAIEALGKANDHLGTAIHLTRSLVDTLNARDDLTFHPLGEDYQDTLHDLFDNLRGTMTELDALNGELSSDSTTLTGDLRAVNDQMNVVLNLFLDIFVDLTDADASDIFEDTSDADIDAITSGKVRGCMNYSHVEADLNVGGIAGTMAIEYELDPEDDLKDSSSVLNRVYESKAVVQQCVNRGDIVSKKDCAGGIVGEMDLGLALRCEAYGSVKSENGRYIGGIVGLSSSKIRACWSKCALSGKSGVGGIIGSGSESSSVTGSDCIVTDCRSLVVIEACEQFAGAIAGRDLGTFHGNLFVSDTLRGIDRRSLSGQAEPIDYAELLTLSGVPDGFRHFTLKFVSDGTTLKTLTFDYGDSFDQTVFPRLTDRSGTYPVWDRTDLTNLRFDTVVTAEYTDYRSALESDALRADGRNVFFVEGAFSSGSTLQVTEQTPDPDEFPQIADSRHKALQNYFSFLSERTLPAMTVYRSVIEQWSLTFPRDANAEHTIRFLPPDGVKRCAVFVRQSDGRWQPVETTSMGSYLCFTVDETEMEVAVLSTSTVWWLWALLAVFCAAVLFLLLRLIRRGRGKAGRAKPAADGTAKASASPLPANKPESSNPSGP